MAVKNVGIVGSGPSGAALASLLAMKGIEVTLFDDGKRPELIVGESLIPGVVPLLRKLGLEERAKAICHHKPGVTFTLNDKEKIEFCFMSLAGTTMPTYAYNAPRPALDELFDKRADELGLSLAATPLAELQAIDPRITAEALPALTVEGSVASRTSYGGTAPDQVRAQIARWKELIE